MKQITKISLLVLVLFTASGLEAGLLILALFVIGLEVNFAKARFFKKITTPFLFLVIFDYTITKP